MQTFLSKMHDGRQACLKFLSFKDACMNGAAKNVASIPCELHLTN
jgi:hypothetical protein